MAKSAISFGLVHIPVELNPVIKNNDTAFNFLHKKCGTRIKYQKICPHCKVEVHNKDIIKGYEYEDDEYVLFEDEDFEKLKVTADTIEIISFVNLKEIDPVYFEKSYVISTKGNNKAFLLFKEALNKAGKVALAKTVIGTKFYYVILRFGKNNVIMNTLFFDEEVKLEETKEKETFEKKEMDMATKLIDAMSGKFTPEKYTDEYQTKIKEAIEQKIDGKELKAPKMKQKKGIKDLMKALEESLKEYN